MIGSVGELSDDLAEIADAHAGVEEQRVFFADNQVGDGFFRLMRFVDSEDVRDDPIHLEPGITDRDAFKSFVFGTRQGAAPFRLFGRLRRCKCREESKYSRRECR